MKTKIFLIYYFAFICDEIFISATKHDDDFNHKFSNATTLSPTLPEEIHSSAVQLERQTKTIYLTAIPTIAPKVISVLVNNATDNIHNNGSSLLDSALNVSNVNITGPNKNGNSQHHKFEEPPMELMFQNATKETTQEIHNIRSTTEQVSTTIPPLNNEQSTTLTEYIPNLPANSSFELLDEDNSSFNLRDLEGDLHVRKCCEEHEYFNLESYSCEAHNDSSIFFSAVLPLFADANTKRINLLTALLTACPNKDESPSITTDVTNDTFALLPTGELYDVITEFVYQHSEYCLELAGGDRINLSLTLAFCPQPQFEEDEVEQHIVRKCCKETEFYNVELHKCASLEGQPLFRSFAQGLTFENEDVYLEIISSRIHQCPDDNSAPKVLEITENQYKLRHNGELIEVATGIRYDISHYCLELVGPNSEEISLMIALCPKLSYVQKCCPMNRYFDEIHLDCLPISESEVQKADILKEFKKDVENYAAVPMGSFLTCQNTFPVKESAQKLIIENELLCNQITCFERSDYCVEYVGKANRNLNAIAFYCQKEYFVKCCKRDHILSEAGCIEHHGGKSVLLQQLQNTRNFINSFDSNKCKMGRAILLDESLSSYVSWWISNDGRLIVKSDDETIKILDYCIDDYLNSRKVIGPGAMVCEDAVSHLVPNDKNALSFSENLSLGRCCPLTLKKGSVAYFSHKTGNCELSTANQTLLLDLGLILEATEVPEMHFHDFPECPPGIEGYNKFPFQRGPYDYAKISEKGILKIISKDGRCHQREDVVKDRDYCIEYTMDEGGKLVANAFVCAFPSTVEFYQEKFVLVTVLMGISCICLLLTLVFLFTMRVRRGLVTVRKVNTLAGRILVSFVFSHLLGFVAFTLTQHENFLVQVNSSSCYVVAGLIEFFNLATFCWNTSICLESLLLTFHIAISECLRYLLHSLWAWGFPFIMMLIMFVMDFHRQDLACDVITPKIGVYDCFISDANALMVYFYVPILITLIANVSLIIGAKAMRKARLRRLEAGPRTTQETGRKVKSEITTVKGQSGLRTHQHKNAKEESLRIVLWTGGLWFAELAGFVIRNYLFSRRSEKWYRYLWYIPSSINALRGVGIFAIVVLTAEKRKEMQTYMKKTKLQIQNSISLPWSKSSKSRTQESFVVKFASKKSSFDDQRKRNMSVVTMISNLSTSIYSNSRNTKSGEEVGRKTSVSSYISAKLESIKKDHFPQRKSSEVTTANPARKIGMIRSVSQIDRRASTSSSTGSFLEELEMNKNPVTRKYSSNPNTVQLPKLQEEDNSKLTEESEQI